MKKIAILTLTLMLVLALAACGKVKITMQEIYDASQTNAMLKNHESVYIRNEMDGEIWRETYLTKEYAFDYIPDEAFPWVQFMTDDVRYHYDAGSYLVYLFVTPDGVGDFAKKRTESYASMVLGEEILDQSIASVSKKGGRITATTALSSKELEIWAADGVTAGKLTYVLDAKSRELVSTTADYTYEDGTVFSTATEIVYDAEAPEMMEVFLKYANQTEDLRNVTVITSPGTEKEVSQSVQTPKGVIVGFEFDDELGYAVEFYTDAACTESYDPYADTDSDLTIYVKWTNT